MNWNFNLNDLPEASINEIKTIKLKVLKQLFTDSSDEIFPCAAFV